VYFLESGRTLVFAWRGLLAGRYLAKQIGYLVRRGNN
jgi:hypothetical protein